MKAAHRQTNLLRTVYILAFLSFVNMFVLHFAYLLDVIFLQCGLQKYAFQVASFRIERTISLSRLVKVLKLTSLCNLHSRTKELCWSLPDSRLLSKAAQPKRTKKTPFHAVIPLAKQYPRTYLYHRIQPQISVYNRQVSNLHTQLSSYLIDL